MSSTAKKILRQQAKKQAAERLANAAERRAEVTKLIDNGKYADAVDLIAELVGDKIIDADLCCQLATCYFMTGDFERAGKWVENTFIYDKGHLGSRMLLGRLCLMENRVNDAFQIFEYILQNYSGVLTEDDRITIEDSLFAYCRLEEDNLRANYPLLTKFMQIAPAEEPESEPVEEPAEAETAPEAEEAKPKITVMSLDDIKKNISNAVSDSTKVIKENLSDAVTLGKETVQEKVEEVKETVQEKVEEVKEQVSEVKEQVQSIDSSSIKETLARMKEKIKAAAEAAAKAAEEVDAKHEAQDKAEEAEEAAAPEETVEAEDTAEAEAEETACDEAACEAPACDEPVYAEGEETPDTIMGRSIALTAKLRLLNFFAGAHYVDGNTAKAEAFLSAAMSIDSSDEATIKNMAVVKSSRGDRDEALKLAAQLPTADLTLLYVIKNA